MQMRMKVEDPGKIVYTVITTATADEWEKFRDALDFVANKAILPLDQVRAFRAQIDNILAQARKIYYPPESSDNGSAEQK